MLNSKGNAVHSGLGLVVGLLFMTQTVFSQHTVPDNIAVIPPPEQPIPFSHKQHTTLGLPCANRHTNLPPGQKMGFPAEATCMNCHTGIAKDKPAIIKLKQYVDNNEPVPWQRVYEITPGINWSHRSHIQAGLQCEVCHGDVRQLDVMSQVKAVTAMASCISCHKAHETESKCETCHAWPVDEDLLSVE